MLDLEIIRDSILFKNIDDIDFDIICAETKPSAKFFSAGEPVQLQGDKVEKIGIIAEGRILSFKYHYDGSSQLLRAFHQNDIIGLEAVSSTFFTSPKHAHGRIRAVPSCFSDIPCSFPVTGYLPPAR